MKKFIVISYAIDRREIYYDSLVATDRDGAITKVQVARPYAKVLDVLTTPEISKLHQIINIVPIEVVEAAWEKTLQALCAEQEKKGEERR